MRITFLGHSCFSLDINGSKILFDPAMSYLQTPGVNADDIEVDHMLLSHGHGDHVADAERIAKRTNCKVISNFEIVSWLGAKGVENGLPMNFGGQYKFDFGTVKYVYATHSSVLPDGLYGGNPGGFVITSEEHCIYYAGDTALTYDMKLLGEFHNISVAIFPIGDVFTMGIDDAVIASHFIGCDKIIGMHYDTFPPIVINKEEAKKKFATAGKELILLNINESLEL